MIPIPTYVIDEDINLQSHRKRRRRDFCGIFIGKDKTKSTIHFSLPDSRRDANLLPEAIDLTAVPLEKHNFRI